MKYCVIKMSRLQISTLKENRVILKEKKHALFSYLEKMHYFPLLIEF